MNVFTSSELASRTKAVCDTVREQGCAFVTNNGKVDCMMIDLSMFETLNDAVRSYDRWVAQYELERMWLRNSDLRISMGEIDDEIAEVRKARKKRAK
ncbi:MAG: hypothetical protein HFJ66_04865 [Eggerthellaceae bacterium]|nr:hypothetical protein [Eggerthellaceae bacterium]